jgi:hypothetical protein
MIPVPPAVVVAIDHEKEIPTIKLQPLAAKLATEAAPGTLGGTSKVTSRATFMNGSPDAEADVEIDL